MDANNLEQKVTQILARTNKETMKRVLLLGELSLPGPQFRVFRKEIFDLFGSRELRKSAREIIAESMDSNGTRFGQGRRFSELAKEG